MEARSQRPRTCDELSSILTLIIDSASLNSRKSSVLGEGLEDALIEHYLVNEVPVANHLRAQYLQHGCFVGSVVYCIVGSQVLIASQRRLASMLQQLDLVQQHIVAFIISFGWLLLL